MNSIIKAEFIKNRKWILFSLLAIGVLGAVLAIPAFLNLVEFLGQRIPQKNVRFDYIKGFLWAVFLGLTILIWPIRSHDKRALLWVWSVKCFVMLGLMLFYEYHYPLDAYGYFSTGSYNISEWKTIGIIGSNTRVIFITWLHQHSFLNSYHAAKVSFGMIGLIAIYIFYRSTVIFLKQEKLILLYIFALFPSILFWSSVLGKDPFVFFAIAVYSYGVIKLIRIGSLSSKVIMLLGILFAVSMRPWLGFILGLPVFIIVIMFVTWANFKTKIILLCILFSIMLFPTNLIIMRSNLKSNKDVLRMANNQFIGFARGGSAIYNEPPVQENVINVIQEDKKKYRGFSDIMFAVPGGMFTVLFRPLPGDVNNVFGFLAGLEGAFILILFILAIIRMRWRNLLDPIVIWAILVIAIWAAAYSFVGFNLGTICRYRLQILPIFLGLLLYFTFGGEDLLNYRNK